MATNEITSPLRQVPFRIGRPTGLHHAPVCISITSETAKPASRTAVIHDSRRRRPVDLRYLTTITIASTSQKAASQPLNTASTVIRGQSIGFSILVAGRLPVPVLPGRQSLRDNLDE